MSSSTLNLTPLIYDYFQRLSLREPPLIKALREETRLKTDLPHIQIAPEQGQFMAFLVQLMGAKRIIEVGTFTGYSAIWLASVLPDEGELIVCEIEKKRIDIGKPFWERAGVADKITVRLGPALDTLAALLDDGQTACFDFIFIDADKVNYINYYEQALQLLRPGGVVAIDNTLWGGKLADESVNDPSTQALRAFNEQLLKDVRISLSLVPIGDGLTLAYKRT